MPVPDAVAAHPPHRQTRVRLVGRDVRVMFAIAALVCGLCTVPTVFELTAVIAADPADPSRVVVLCIGVVFFGLPAVAAAIAAVRQPKPTIVIDAGGLRLEGTRRRFDVPWSSVAEVSLVISWPNPHLAHTLWRRRFHRRIHIVLEPVHDQADADRGSAVGSDATMLQVPSSPLSPDLSSTVRAIAAAIEREAPQRFAGVRVMPT